MHEEESVSRTILENWQMMECERMALTGVLARMRPRGALEVGVYYGGSLSLTAQFAEHLIAIDIDPAVRGRFPVPANTELLIGASSEMIPRALERFDALGLPLNYALIDAEHSTAGVRRDIELLLAYQPSEPLAVLIHDSGNAGCRSGILSADWALNPHVHSVQCDFVPGQIIEQSINGNRGEVWGGLALGWLDGRRRTGPVAISQDAATMIRGAQFLANDLSVIR